MYAVLCEADNAGKYGQLCLDASESEEIEPFYLGYAYEALTRAESVAGNRDKVDEYLAKAREAASLVKETEDRKLLEEDLDTIT